MIQDYGWRDALQHDFEPYAAEGLVPGRVILQHRGRYRLATPLGELDAELSGRFVHEARGGDYPTAGDWTACAPREAEHAATIHHRLPRSSVFLRRAAGPKLDAQVVAANVETAFLVASLNADLSLRRLERYLAVAWDSGARPVIVLTKADLCADPTPAIAEVERIAIGVPVIAVSAVTGEGLEAVSAWLRPGETAVLLGSSGVGKSTLVNALAGDERMATREIREDDARGRHTTTHRELVLLPGGGLLLDTPGMRELGLWDAEAGVEAIFADVQEQIAALAAQCHFRNCRHEGERGCAVQAARERGEVPQDRWKSWVKLQRELAHLDRKEDPVARAEYRRVWTQRAKAGKARARGLRWDD